MKDNSAIPILSIVNYQSLMLRNDKLFLCKCRIHPIIYNQTIWIGTTTLLEIIEKNERIQKQP